MGARSAHPHDAFREVRRPAGCAQRLRRPQGGVPGEVVFVPLEPASACRGGAGDWTRD
jgi:hypothetical protein